VSGNTVTLEIPDGGRFMVMYAWRAADPGTASFGSNSLARLSTDGWGFVNDTKWFVDGFGAEGVKMAIYDVEAASDLYPEISVTLEDYSDLVDSDFYIFQMPGPLNWKKTDLPPRLTRSLAAQQMGLRREMYEAKSLKRLKERVEMAELTARARRMGLGVDGDDDLKDYTHI